MAAAPAEPTGPAPVFVGRNRELDAVRSLLHRAATDEAQALLVWGDAGVGKTALVSRAAAERGASSRLLVGTCLPFSAMTIPFLPIRTAIRGLGAIEPTPPGVGLGDGDEGDFMTRLESWLDELCRRDRVVLVVDDLQWADRSTLDALMLLIAGPADRRLALVATVRSVEVGASHPLQRWLADVRRLPRLSELELGPLDRVSTGEQITALIGGSAHQSLVEDVYTRGRGNPYLTRLMVAGLRPDARSAPTEFAGNLRSAVLHAWYRLPAPTRRVATVLAVGGRAMHADDVAAVLDDGPGPAEIRARLLDAVDEGVLDVVGDGAFWFHHPLNAEVLEAELGDDERRALHARFADVRERRLLDGASEVDAVVEIADHRHRSGDAREAYRWALAAADAVGGSAGAAERLRLLRRAVALRAGLDDVAESPEGLLRRLRDAAAAVGAHAEELDAVEALLARTDRSDSALVATELLVRRMHLRFSMGIAFIDQAEMREAARLSEAWPSSPAHALALAELAHADVWHGDPRAGAHADRALRAARASGDRRALSYALASKAMVAAESGDATAGVRFAREAIEHALAVGDWWACTHAVMWEANAADPPYAEVYAARLQRRRQEMAARGAPHAYLAWVSTSEAASRMAIGQWRECEERLRLALGSDPGPLADVSARLTAARLATWQGRQAEAESHLERADELFAAGSEFLAFEFDAVRAEVRLGAGDPDGALRAALSGTETGGIAPTRCEWLMPLAARALADRAQAARDARRPVDDVLAELDALQARFPHVIRDIGPSNELWDLQIVALDALYLAERQRALAAASEAEAWAATVDAFRACGFAWEEAYSAWRAAEAYLGRERNRSLGADQLRHGLALARRLKAGPLERRLADLAVRARIPTASPASPSPAEREAMPGLTRREREILALVVAGRTYGEIARELVISEKTVSTHVSHLLAKTGTSNRVELSALALRVGDG